MAAPARAKLNLELRVLGLLPDGRHRVESVMQAISLGDLVEVERTAESSLEVFGLSAPRGPENLAARAAAALGVSARIRLWKRIPSGAGLGGGSADAATVLRLLGTPAAAAAVAPALGSDVPFLLRGGTALASGAGEAIASLPDREGWFAIAWPGYELSTASVYAAWDRVGGDGLNHLTRAAFTVEPRLEDFARRLGDGWRMTGSGSAFFLECLSRDDATAATAGLDCWTATASAVAAGG